VSVSTFGKSRSIIIIIIIGITPGCPRHCLAPGWHPHSTLCHTLAPTKYPLFPRGLPRHRLLSPETLFGHPLAPPCAPPGITLAPLAPPCAPPGTTLALPPGAFARSWLLSNALYYPCPYRSHADTRHCIGDTTSNDETACVTLCVARHAT
jgi:hypothetical protein